MGSLLKEINECIGACGIPVQSIDDVKEYEIGYRLMRDFWGRGIGFEAAKACRDYGFNNLGLTRLISIIEKENKPSVRIAQKLGMLLEKQSTFFGIPVEIYSLKSGFPLARE